MIQPNQIHAMTDCNSYYRVFCNDVFKGNIAKVIEVDSIPDNAEKMPHSSDKTIVYIAPIRDERYAIAWFQHGYAIQRCGHGTLAAAMHLYDRYKKNNSVFYSQNEILETRVSDGSSRNYSRFDITEKTSAKITQKRKYAALCLPEIDLVYNPINYPFATTAQYRSKTHPGYQLVILSDKNAIDDFSLSTQIKKCIEKDALIISAQDNQQTDLIYFRYFAPAYGSDEDSATGSAADILWAYWQPLTASATLCYQQLSSEGGVMYASQAENGIWLEGDVIAIDQL